MQENTKQDLVKVIFPLGESELHNHATETIWAKPVGGNRYQIDNVPFFVYGVSNGDIIFANEQSGIFQFGGIVSHSGHSTYRIFPNDLSDRAGVERSLDQLKFVGCSFERDDNRLIAVDVPADADVYKAYEILENGVEEDLWDFEEGHCGHPLIQS